MITIRLKSMPSGAKSWMPAAYYSDTSVSYPEESMSASEMWSFDPKDDTELDFRFIFYTDEPGEGYTEFASKDLDDVTVVDGKTYIYDYAANTLTVYETSSSSSSYQKYLVYGVLALGVIATLMGLSGKKRG